MADAETTTALRLETTTSTAPLLPLAASSDDDLEAVDIDGHGVFTFSEGQGADTEPSDDVDAVWNDGHGLLPEPLFPAPLELLDSEGCWSEGHGVLAVGASVSTGTSTAAGASVAIEASVAAGTSINGASVAVSSIPAGAAGAGVAVSTVVVDPGASVACGSDGHGVLPVSASDATRPALPVPERSVLLKVILSATQTPFELSATQTTSTASLVTARMFFAVLVSSAR